MFEKLFLQILNMSFTASFVIVAVIVARLLLKKAPRMISYALWAVVLFRLICPFSFESAVSLLPVHANPIPQEIVYQQTPRINTGIPIVNNSVNAVLPAATPDASMNPLQGWLAIGTFLWLCGIAALAIYSAISLLLLKRKLHDAICENENVYLVEGLATPFVMGLFRPKVYLPASLTDNEKRCILLHEQTHIKRLDHVVKIAGFAVLCLHWFNPLAWIAFFLCGKDMEMSCDEAVIKRLGSEVKKEYSSSLLALATGKRIVGGSPLAFGEGDTKSRIKNVLNYKKPAFWAVVVSIVAVIAVAIGLAVNPIAQRPAMLWAKNLQAGDIVSVELVTTYGDENQRYQFYEPERFSDIVKLVNGSRGKYLPQPEAIAGGGMTLYITTRDGMRHSVGNNANVYLEIDGDSFQMSRFAVDGWGWYNNGNAPVPEDFSFDNKKLLTLDELKIIAQKGDAISWGDFAPYEGKDVGFGLYIMHYPMAEPYYLDIGGVPDKAPMYVQLSSANTKDYIDIREESIDDFIQSDSDFSAATITEHANGKEKSSVKLTDTTDIAQLRTLLLVGELTDLQSTNDAPNKEDYLHISFQMKDELLHYYVYVKYGKYYIEQPYNGIREITADNYTAFVKYLQADTGTTPAGSIVNSYYAGQSSRAFNMLQKSIFQNWVEYDNSGALNTNLINPKWDFDNFTQYYILDQNMDSSSDKELYYCTFSDENNQHGYVVVSYNGDSLSKIDRVETPYLYDLQANIDNITAKIGETGLDLSTAAATRVRVADENRNTTREAIRIIDGNANQYLYYFDELTTVS